MKRSIILLLAVLTLMAYSLFSRAECLPTLTAPGKFLNPPPWGNDQGPLIPGFLVLPTGATGYSTVHGIDLSHHNFAYVSYDELKRCGASFAIVKMDERFRSAANELHERGITVIPYYYLSTIQNSNFDYKRHPEIFSTRSGESLSMDELTRLMEDGRSMGKTKAAEFVGAYRQHLDADHQRLRIAGMDGQIVALDVEEAFTVPSTAIQRRAYGRFYAAMLAGWVLELRKSYPDIVLLFYTFPDMYDSYLVYALPEDHKIIHGMPVWIANTRPDGGDVDLSRKTIERLCKSASAGNRCIVHQYTHRGMFGVRTINATKKHPPDHVDVDRFFQVETVSDATGKQYVRWKNAGQ
ncbi:hypothetical protein [Burkholderia stagnalis]|uniref:hypothetical protein n=1 Tax=Burkholderia stagnalis TaxID=1503054 RepID=UPI0009BD0D4D|nr:hypothetical protein [Burkholderia stagnalis]